MTLSLWIRIEGIITVFTFHSVAGPSSWDLDLRLMDSGSENWLKFKIRQGLMNIYVRVSALSLLIIYL